RGAEARAQFLQSVEIHGRVHDLRGRDERNRRTARDHGEQIVPAAADAAAMGIDEFTKSDAHLLLDNARLVHMAADLEELGALVVLASEALQPSRTAPQNRRHD